jgi:hypothetical protein
MKSRGQLFRRALNLLNSVTADDSADSIGYLEEYKP